ncbi:hypothetical protein ICC15_06715 [Piscirickettsia salmonis]|nr:hypothetical protein [Piscirickettsia salmonis]QNR81614.1 hypothetical protein ICC15_06715 [Piscirickettsia salmonis]
MQRQQDFQIYWKEVCNHDKVTRFLNKNHFGSKELWSYEKHVRQYEEEVGGVLSLDDIRGRKALYR